MGYTVKEVAEMAGVSVRTLHFYDETGLLAPAYVAANGYRIYEEPQLLMLQQILFYRELGFELKKIRRILGHADFEKVAALQSHRLVLQEKLTRTSRLIETIDQTVEHLKGAISMESREMFAGFTVAAGEDRFDESVTLAGEPHDCKVSGRDNGGTLCVFEINGTANGPRHLHREQSEWIYILAGEVDFEVGERQFRAGAGESAYIPRNVAHAWASASEKPVRVIDLFEPAGSMEEFFREVGSYDGGPPIHEVLTLDELRALFEKHGMTLVGPPLRWSE